MALCDPCLLVSSSLLPVLGRWVENKSCDDFILKKEEKCLRCSVVAHEPGLIFSKADIQCIIENVIFGQ